MSIGLEEAARRTRHRMEVRLAIDKDPFAARVYRANFPRAGIVSADVRDLFDGQPGDEASAVEELVLEFVGELDILLGGPPCQGHSNLNNHTRGNDPKNGLYLAMARAAETLQPSLVVIENVASILQDSEHVVDSAIEALEKCGYLVAERVLDLSRVGIPQLRKRHVLLASRLDSIEPAGVLEGVTRDRTQHDVRWAIGDLVGVTRDDFLDEPSAMSPDNRGRVDYLFDNDLYDLPNARRPACHRDDHSYKSMYGRLAWGEPAQTITTGFTSMGQGRFVHPAERRTLTPREAARLQTIPDWFEWAGTTGRNRLATLIGNAVPPLMMVDLGQELVRGLAAER